MSSHFTKTGFVDLAENIPIIAPSEAYEDSNISLKLTPL